MKEYQKIFRKVMDNKNNFFYEHISPKMKESIIISVILLFNLLIVLSKLTQDFLEINPYDGVKYIESGRMLFNWGLRDLSWGPLVAFIYAPIYLIIGQSPNWFMLSTWFGNVVLFLLMWISFYYLACQLPEKISKPVFIGILFTSMIYFRVMQNQSDALFVSLSSLALANLISYRNNNKTISLLLASTFVGLGVFARVETIILVAPLILFTILFSLDKHSIFKSLLIAFLPILFLLSVFIILNLIIKGHPNLGIGGKSYFSFTHPLVQNFIPGSKNHEAFIRGEAIFGTFEENQGSVIRAIMRNPVAVLERIYANVLEIPVMISNYFGNLHRRLLIFFSLIGVYVLAKGKDKKILLLLLLWPSHVIITLIFESFHFIPQSSYFFLILSGIGITYLLSNQSSQKDKIFLFLFSIILLIISLIGQHKPEFALSILLLLVSTTNILTDEKINSTIKINALPGVVLLAGLILFENSFVFPTPQVGKTEDEIAIHFMIKNFPEQSNVVAYFPRSPVAAKMNHIPFPYNINNKEELLLFLSDRQISMIYIDDKTPIYSSLLENIIIDDTNMFDLIHISESEEIRIYGTNLSANEIDE